MRGALFLILFTLSAWAGDGGAPASASPGFHDWQLPYGKPPSKAEFTAVMAACQDRLRGAGKDGAIEACLAGDYGMRRVD